MEFETRNEVQSKMLSTDWLEELVRIRLTSDRFSSSCRSRMLSQILD